MGLCGVVLILGLCVGPIEKKNWIREHPGYSFLIVLFGFIFILYQIGVHSVSTAKSAIEPQMTPEMIAAQQKIDARAAALHQAQQKEWDDSKAGKICASHPDWDHDTCQVIAARKVRIGMTAEQAKASWGTPDDVNRTTTVNGVSEQWVYDGSYLYFDEGILTSIQN